jgi:hypothetical protein
VGSTKSTALNLLTREGAVACLFEPELTSEQYDSLFNIVPRAETKVELESYLRRFAEKWQITVTIDGELRWPPNSSAPAPKLPKK